MAIFKKPALSKKFIWRAALVFFAAVIVNVAALAIAKPFVLVPSTFSPFFYSSVVELTVAGVAGAAAVFVLMSSLVVVKNLNRTYLIVSIIALALSYIPDFQLPYSLDSDNIGATPAAIAILLLMHTLSAAIVIWGFYKHNENPTPEQ